ncbi:type I glutamate--ammonia ligase [Microbacterium esteraromaticum]|uniref:Glutamine synthetase n=1 Tax=Microbacterium esteraromaticum TaxID=57043 RepID=A0A939DXM0_9MICO|nr:type I glutamate--ammonia ligase [Microbacterium esteraromaticum]MBN7792480.1 type I glutamate--ammonia ligase [Microbacterium esteraromaticum]MBN8206239.1 type I glutamate--ammonia ligase [Microbacterium esteraromaticum]MBN8416394.1 type I glutamate--ammonia ligase [Microbacterium esteraromaticum]MCA1306408.1 type I glutamate--ammonia ligase [Microbacterium esteraromaticum]
MFTEPAEVIRYIEENDVKFLDIRFTDLPGVQQHFNIPASTVDEDFFRDGQLFDGSSIRGFASIHESDMQLIPDVTTAYLDPFRAEKTLIMVFDIYNPRTGDIYAKDPRQVAKKAEQYLASTGIADTAFFAPEAEFYIFDEVRYEVSAGRSFYSVDSDEAAWNSGRKEEGGNLGNKTPFKGGYFPVSPVDKQADIRDDMCLRLGAAGLILERSHHEVGTAGQAEINYRFDTMVRAADDVLKFKYIVKNTAEEWGKTVTFMPKPLFGDNGSGMHTHQSLWLDGKPLFFDEAGYGQLSDIARWYIGGLLKHADAVLAFTNPTLNSYHRLVKHFEAPVNLAYSAGNRSAAVRIPLTGSNPKAKRIEFRVPDASSNPYLAFAAQMMAGLDGIKNRIEPMEPIDKDLYELPPEEAANIPQVPNSLLDSLEALRNDHDFLLEGGVFTKDLIETWIDYKYNNEILPMAQRPHPYEFELYYGV